VCRQIRGATPPQARLSRGYGICVSCLQPVPPKKRTTAYKQRWIAERARRAAKVQGATLDRSVTLRVQGWLWAVLQDVAKDRKLTRSELLDRLMTTAAEAWARRKASEEASSPGQEVTGHAPAK
jgi:predicted DNA-binding ribbon-helix-helix protein